MSFVPMKLKRHGVEMRIVLDGKVQVRRKVGPALLKAIARARRWFEEVASGRVFISDRDCETRATRQTLCRMCDEIDVYSAVDCGGHCRGAGPGRS